MKQYLNTAILASVLLTLAYSVVCYGAATIDLAGPLFVGGALIAALWAAKLFISERISWIKSPVHWPVLAFVGYAIVRYFTSPVEFDSRVELLYIALYALVYFAVAFNLYHRRDLTFALLTLLVLAVFQSVHGIWQYATSSNRVLFAEGSTLYIGRASGSFVNPNHLAAFLTLVLGMLLARLILHRPAARVTFGTYAGPKLVEGYLVLIAAVAIVLSGSRGSWIALGFMLVVFVFWAWFPGAVSRWVVGALVALLALATVLVFNAPVVRERIAAVVRIPTEPGGKLEMRDATLGHRTLMWNASIDIAKEHPLFGSGPGTWEWFQPPHRDARLQIQARHAHNDVLQLTAEYGAVGLLLVAAFFAAYFWHVAQLSSFANYSDQRAFAVGSGFAVGAILIHSLGDYHFHVPALALTVVILIALGVSMESGDARSQRVVLERRTQLILACVLLAAAVLIGWYGPRVVKGYQLLTAAEELRVTNDLDEALAHYEQALAVDPRLYAAHRGRGDVLLARAKLAVATSPDTATKLVRDAITAYRRSEELNALDPQLFAGLGEALRLNNELPPARTAWDQALRLDPNNADLQARIGYAHRDAELKEEAIQRLTKSLDLLWNPKHYDALAAMGYRWMPPQERVKATKTVP